MEVVAVEIVAVEIIAVKVVAVKLSRWKLSGESRHDGNNCYRKSCSKICDGVSHVGTSHRGVTRHGGSCFGRSR